MKTVTSPFRRLLISLIGFTFGWLVAPYLFNLFVILLPPIRDGYTVNIHLYGSSRWIVASTLATYSYYYLPMSSRYFTFLSILIWKTMSLLILSILTDLQLWIPSFVEAAYPTQIIQGVDEIFLLPLRSLVPIGAVPVNFDQGVSRWTFAEVLLPVYLIYIVGLIIFQFARLAFNNLFLHKESATCYEKFSFGRYDISYRLTTLVLYLNWIQILPFPFENAEVVTLLIPAIPVWFLFLWFMDYLSVKMNSRKPS